MNDTIIPWDGPLAAVEWIAAVGDGDEQRLVAGCGLLVAHKWDRGCELVPLVMHLCGTGRDAYIDAVAVTPEFEAEAQMAGEVAVWHTPPRAVMLNIDSGIVRERVRDMLWQLNMRIAEAGE